MAKKVKGSKIVRFEYIVINEKWFLEVEDGKSTSRSGEVVDYFYCYLKRGNMGTKRFVMGFPKISPVDGSINTIEEEVSMIEGALLHSVMRYMEEADALDEYYEEKFHEDEDED